MARLQNKLIIGTFSLLLAGCEMFGAGDPVMDASGNEVPEDHIDAVVTAAGAPPILVPGDRFSFNNPAVSWQVVGTDQDGNIAWQADNGEAQITAPNPLLPALEWSSADRGSGRRLISNMDQSMFPLEPGKSVSFRSTVDTDMPPYAWEFDWHCTVGGLEQTTVPAGTFLAYRIGCGRQVPDEVIFFYSPEVGNYVRLLTTDSSGGTSQERQLTAFTRSNAPMQAMMPAVSPPGEVVLESEEPDQMTLPTGPTALGMVAEAGFGETQAPAPDQAPQSELMNATTETPQPPAQTASAPPSTTTQTPSATVSPGTIAVHLASYKDPVNADKGWQQLLAANGDQLSGTTPLVRRVDLGSKGIFYRLHAGPVANQAQAKEICRILSQRGIYCKVSTLDS